MGEDSALKENIFSLFGVFDGVFAFFEVLATILFLGTGFLLLGFCIYRFFYSRYNTSYRPVMGKIVGSEISESYHHGSVPGMVYTPHIEYEYQINGVTYQSSKLFIFIESFGSSSKHEIIQFQNRYPLGSDVTIFVHSGSPEKAYLDSNAPAKGLMLFMGIVFIAGGFLILNIMVL